MFRTKIDVPNKNGFYEQNQGRNNGRNFSQSEHVNPHHESNSLYEKTTNGYNDREGERHRESNEQNLVSEQLNPIMIVNTILTQMKILEIT